MYPPDRQSVAQMTCLNYFGALVMALAIGHRTLIFHFNQGCQFISGEFGSQLKADIIKVSWSSRGRSFDIILLERLWRKVSHEEVYLRPMAITGKL